VIAAPLIVQGRILGTLSLITTRSGRTYDEGDLILGKDLARRAALAVENARLYRQAQDASDRLRRAIVVLGEQQQQLRTLQRLTNLLNRHLADLPELLQALVYSVCESLPAAEFGLIVLANPQTQQLEVTATAGKKTDRIQSEDSFEVGQGWIGQVYSSGDPLLIQLAADVAPSEEEIPSALCAVPIETPQDGRLGVLAVGSWQSDRTFAPEDQQLLMAFGEQAAIALNNARLIRTLEEREERLAMQNDLLARQNWELDQQRQQIQRQNDQLQEVSRLKSQFLATMSHELRTPMNAVIGFSQLLLRQRQHPLHSQHADMVERILNNGRNLLSLIDDILDLSKIEAGRLELNLEEFNIDSLVRGTIEELRALAASKDLALEVNNYLNDPYVLNDRKRLRQVMVNLISNAIKFTETGRVELSIEELPHGYLCITVDDTGIGIDPEDLQAIFQEFRQADQTRTRRYSGTGLGLAIADWLVRIMNGTIHVESELGQGSTFRVEIPRYVELDAAFAEGTSSPSSLS
jgi:signal transduction histidine kinase